LNTTLLFPQTNEINHAKLYKNVQTMYNSEKLERQKR